MKGVVQIFVMVAVMHFPDLAFAQKYVPHSGNMPLYITLGGMCIDSLDGKADGNVALQLMLCDGSGRQAWTSFSHPDNRDLFILKNFESGKCLDVINSSRDDGANLVQSDCNFASPSQIWRQKDFGGIKLPSWVTLQNFNSGKCIEAPAVFAGTLLRQVACAANGRSSWQRWQL